MHGDFRVEQADEADFQALTAVVATCFKSMPVEQLINGLYTQSSLNALGGRYLHAHRLHQEQFSSPAMIKCVHVDPETHAQTIVGTAQWYIYPRKRTAEEVKTPHYLLGCDWMQDGPDKEKAIGFFKPFLDGRIRWMGGKAHGLLMYMAVLPEWRKRGVATMCVQWGIDKCEELGIPAYLEASDLGVPVYTKLGFKTVEEVEYTWEDTKDKCPIMIRESGHKKQDRDLLKDTEKTSAQGVTGAIYLAQQPNRA
jgi:GNAT superfamily N-acetyltransferase